MNEDYKLFVEELKKLGATDDQILKALEYKIKEDQTKAQQTQVPQDTGLLAPFRHMAEQAQLEADPNAPKPMDAFKNAWERGINLSKTSDIISFDNGTPDATQLEQVAGLQQEQQAIPTSPSYAKFNEAKTVGESLKALIDNPVQVIGEVFIESLAGQAGNWEGIAGRAAEGGAVGAAAGTFVLPGIGTAAGLKGGAAAGLVTGMAETSMRLEWAGKFIEALQEAGVDTTDPASLQEAFSNDEIISKARELAYKKAIPIAVFDLISGGVAGRIVSKPAKSLIGKLGQGAAEFAVQGGLGGGGELAGQLSAGENINPSSIIAEVIGEGATAPVEIAAGGITHAQNVETDPIAGIAEDQEDTTGDVLLDNTIDEQYDEIARRMDALDFEPVSDDEIAENMGALGIEDTHFSDVAEENELTDREYTPEEARDIQLGAPVSQGEREQFLAEDDSEATPLVDVRKPFSAVNEENELLSENITPEEAGRIQAQGPMPSQSEQEGFLAEDDETVYTPEKLAASVENAGKYEFTKPAPKTEKPAEPATTKAAPIAPTPKEDSDKGSYSFGKPVEKTPIGTAPESKTPMQKRLEKLQETSKEEVPKRVRTKATVDPDQKRQDQIVKYQGQLANITKEKKPGKRLKRLQILNENTLELPEVNEQVQAEIQKIKDRTSAQAAEKEFRNLSPKERIARIRERASNEAVDKPLETIESAIDRKDITEDAYKQLEDAFAQVSGRELFSTEYAELSRIVNNIKKDWDKVLAPARDEAKAEEAARKAETRTKQGDKDSHLTAIAKAVQLDNPVGIKQAVEEYKAWRKKQGLAETTDDKALKAANAEFYQERADKEIKREAEVQAAKERAERKKKSDAIKKAKNKDATGDLKRELGLDEDADVDFLDEAINELDSVLPKSVHDRPTYSNVKKVEIYDLIDRMTKVYQGVVGAKFLKALTSLIKWSDNAAKLFYKNGLEIYLVDNLIVAKGLSINDLGQNRKVLVIDRAVGAHTDAHELIHYIVRAIIASSALNKGIPVGTNRSFSRYGKQHQITYLAAANDFYDKVERIYQSALREYRDQLTQIGRKFDNNDTLTDKDVSFLTTVSLYLTSRGYKQYESITNSKQTRELIDDTWDVNKRKLVYGLYDSDEMVAEAFSSPFFMMVMGQLETDIQIKEDRWTRLIKGRSVKSAFRAIVEAFKELMDAVIKIIPMRENSYLDLLVDHMTDLERKFLSEEGGNLENIESSEILTKDMAALVRERSALYMAMGGPQKPLNPHTPELRKLILYIANQWYKRKDIVSLEGVEAELEKLNAKTTKNKFKQAEANFIWKKIQKYRQKVVDAKAKQANALAYAKQYSRDYKRSRAFRRDVNDFADVDLDTLDIAQVAVIERGILELVTGGVPLHRAYTLVNKYRAVQKLNALLEHAGKYGKNPGLFRISISHLSNPATFSSILAKYNTKAAQTMFNEIFGTLVQARTNTLHETKFFTEGLFDIVNKYSLSHSDFARAGMYGAIFSTQLPPSDPDYWTEIEFNAARVVQNSENKIRAYDREVYRGRGIAEADLRSELKIAKDLYDRITASKSMSGILSKGQQELYDELRSFAGHFEADMERNTVGVWGADFKKQFNYFPTFALGNVRTGNKKGNDADSLIPADDVNNLWEALQKNKNYGQIIGRQSGFTREKQLPSDYFYDYDIMSIAHKFAPSILFDLYAARELKVLNQLINGTNNKPIKSKGQDIDSVFSGPVVNGLNRQIKSIVGGVVLYDEGLGRAFLAFQALKNNTATALLGTTGQFLVQTSSAIPASIIMAPKGFPRALKTVTLIERGQQYSALKEALDKLADKGASITIRDILFEKWETIEDKNKKGLSRGLASWRSTAEQATTWMLRNGDKFAARLVWFSEFYAQGGDINNPSVEHIMAAERAVGLLQNMSDVAFSAPFLRTNNQAARILYNMLYAFQSFALNNGLNLFYSAKYSFTTNNREARQVLTSTILMAAAYNAVAEYVIRPAYNAGANLIFGTDDDDEDEKNYTKEEAFLWSTAFDLLISQWAPSIIEGAVRLGIADQAEKRAKREGEKFDQYTDLPIYAPRTSKDVMASGMGLYGDVGTGIVDIAAIMYQASDNIANGEELNMDEVMLSGLRTFLMFERAIPMRGDMQKLLRNYEKKIAAEARSAKKNDGTTIPGIETGTEFEIPSFEVPEYEIEIPDDPTQIE